MITRIPVTITLCAPFATRSNGTGGFGIDLPLARDSKGRVMLAGSHVIGKMSQATDELAALLSGTPEGDGYEVDREELYAQSAQLLSMEMADGREARRNLSVSDFRLETPEDKDRPRTRIAIDTVNSTVADGMLQVIEQPFRPGATLEFSGELRLFGPVDEARRNRMRRALEFVTQFGGLRSVGFGENRSISFGKDVTARQAPGAARPAGRHLTMRLSFLDPFCAGEARNTPNTYRSAGFVPGGVIKGALARQLLASRLLTGFLDQQAESRKLTDAERVFAAAFGALTVRHALPIPKQERVRRHAVLPDSLAIIEGDTGPCLVDLAGLGDPSRPVLLNGQVPVHSSDWKLRHHNLASVEFALPKLPGHALRVRTQINETLRAAMASRLFGVEYTTVDDHNFVAQIEIPEPHDPAVIARVLKDICANGLGGIGRGGALAEVALDEAGEGSALEPYAAGQDRVVMVLQSAALIRNPRSPGKDLRADYETGLREIGLPESWALTAMFARERLAGGSFFLNRLSSRHRYAPWLLTEPGATFVFGRTAGNDPFPDAWIATGLPVPQSVIAFHGLTDVSQIYRACPYLPQNGYGEVGPGVRTRSGEVSHVHLAPVQCGIEVEPIDLLVLGGQP